MSKAHRYVVQTNADRKMGRWRERLMKPPTTPPRRKKMDLSFPIFKLEERARYERECLEGGVEGMRMEMAGAGQEPTYGSDEDAQRRYDATKKRVEACEEAVRILKQATGED